MDVVATLLLLLPPLWLSETEQKPKFLFHTYIIHSCIVAKYLHTIFFTFFGAMRACYLNKYTQQLINIPYYGSQTFSKTIHACVLVLSLSLPGMLNIASQTTHSRPQQKETPRLHEYMNARRVLPRRSQGARRHEHHLPHRPKFCPR